MSKLRYVRLDIQVPKRSQWQWPRRMAKFAAWEQSQTGRNRCGR